MSKYSYVSGYQVYVNVLKGKKCKATSIMFLRLKLVSCRCNVDRYLYISKNIFVTEVTKSLHVSIIFFHTNECNTPIIIHPVSVFNYSTPKCSWIINEQHYDEQIATKL